MEQSKEFQVVLVTCGELTEARKIAKSTVEKRLAACVNILTYPVESIYTWEGKLEDSSEYLLLIKTTAEKLPDLEREVQALHSYDTPEFLALPVSSGAQKYLAWLGSAL